jgi:hypothetical protein
MIQLRTVCAALLAAAFLLPAGCVTRRSPQLLDDAPTVLRERTLADGTREVVQIEQDGDTPRLRQVRERRDAHGAIAREVVELPLERAPSQPWPNAGLALSGAAPEVAKEVFGDGRNLVVVTNVEVGSPAWVAGVRRGDLVETVDGAPVPTARELSDQVFAVGSVEGSMQWQVRRGRHAPHTAVMQLHDYTRDFELWVPLVTRIQDQAALDRWTVGPFGLVMSNRNSYVDWSPTREPETRNVFSAVLGLFRVETTPRSTEVRLLWFLCLET